MPVTLKMRKAMMVKKRFARQSVAASRTRRLTGRPSFGLPAVLRGARPEIKSVDIGQNGGTPPQVKVISTTALFYGLNLVQEGSSFYNRVGRKIMMRSLHFVGNLVPTGNAATVNDFLRIMLIYDRQPNGAFPAASDVLLDTSNDGTVTTTSYSNLNMNNAERFQVLRNIKWGIPVNKGALDMSTYPIIDFHQERTTVNEFIRLNNLETHFKSSSSPAVVGDISTGGLFLMVFGNTAAASAAYEIAFNARLRYHDV